MSYKKVVITKYGNLEVLAVKEEDTLPKPKAGEVRIKYWLLLLTSPIL